MEEEEVNVGSTVSPAAPATGVIETPNWSVSMLTPEFRDSVTGILTALPGVPDALVVETVPSVCANSDVEANRIKAKTTADTTRKRFSK